MHTTGRNLEERALLETLREAWSGRYQRFREGCS